MRVGRSEALDIFRKWFSEGILIRCDFRFRGFAASLRGRIVHVSNERVDLLSDDTFSELAIVIGADLEFAYGDPRDFPEEARSFAGCLIVFFPRMPGGPEPDLLCFLEFIEPA